MSDGLELPIALRRSRRGSHAPQQQLPAKQAAAAVTPAKKPRTKKRVRFSDPGPTIANLDEDELSTGLTPMIRRTCLSGRPQRRHSTPARPSSATAGGSGIPLSENSESPFSETICFLPLRQVLDGRVKRRLRRNGLSEEMNSIYSERKRRAEQTKAEIDRLKAELTEKDDEISRLQDETHVYDTDRVWELERQVAGLRKELADRAGLPESSSPAFDWTIAARDPFSDDFMDLDDSTNANEEFGETTMGDLICSTPSRRARASFPTPPTTSPAAEPMTPRPQCPTPRSAAGVQTSLPDPEKEQLEDELSSLQLEICKLTTVLEEYSGFTSRLSEKLSRFSSDNVEAAADASSPQAAVEEHLSTLLQTLSDRTAALVELDSSLSDLGFPGSDACEIITSIAAAFRTARLELEYLTPGEIPLPLTSSGAAIIDLLLDRLRELSKKSREAEESVDEYHSIELSLRQQLGARVEVMDGMTSEMKRLEGEAKEKDDRIAELEVGLERLKGAVRSYARDVSELEGLVQRMEGELEASNTGRKEDRVAHDKAVQQQAGELSDKGCAIADLETKLTAAVAQTQSLQEQMEALQTSHADAINDVRASHKAELAQQSKAQGHALALRDARVSELRGEIERVNAALRAAHETVRQLRVENGQMTTLNEQLTSENTGLSAKIEVDRRKAKEVIDNMKAELERVARMSEGFLMTPKKTKSSVLASRRDSGLGDEDQEDELSLLSTPSSSATKPGNFLSGNLARKAKGKKRRRYDSGLGFLDEEEIDA
ncbi:hypothetical protein GQ53DRAFT_748921 [Thozetella sp. PMI_491]|nr:hypothetical protein GQ53DRAFT_748921 [Thozetella sp. PMI_491]